MIANYNPLNVDESNEIEHRLEEHEEIVGFYGADNNQVDQRFAKFGFIVKVTPL